MKLGLEWDYKFDGSIEEQAVLMKKHGIDACFVGLEEPDLDEIVYCLRKHDIVCESCHAPFKNINDMWLSGEGGEKVLQTLCDSVDACARNKIPVLVVHLSSGKNPPRMNDIGFERYDRLMQYANEKGVTIAYENIRRLDNVAYMLENYSEAGFCWDVGHEACYMDGKEFMVMFGNRIVSLHLHDNTAIYGEDLHLLPYDGKIDMEKAAMHLAKSGYKGSIMMEVRPDTARISDREEFYIKAYERGMRFAESVEKYKNI